MLDLHQRGKEVREVLFSGPFVKPVQKEIYNKKKSEIRAVAKGTPSYSSDLHFTVFQDRSKIGT